MLGAPKIRDCGVRTAALGAARRAPDQTVVHRGLDPNVPISRFTDGTGNVCCAILQNIATDADGAVFAAWCQFDNAPDGVFAQGVDLAASARVKVR